MKCMTVIVSAVFAWIVAGCGDSGQSVPGISQKASAPAASVVATQGPTRVALVMKTLTNPFFVEMEKGARRAEKDSGIELLVKTATQETSIEQQIQIVEEMIQAKVAAIVIAPGDSQRLVSSLKKAQDAGIKVVNIDNRLDAEAMKKNSLTNVPFISVDNEKAAYEAVKLATATIKKSVQAAIFEGIRTADNANQRKNGAVRAFAENKNIRVVAMESANWKIDEAYEVAKNVFKANPDIKLVFCANDMMAIGVMKYLQESKRDQVTVVGFDALDEAVSAIKEGKMFATVDQQAAEQGYQGVMTAIRALRGDALPTDIKVDARVLTKAEIK